MKEETTSLELEKTKKELEKTKKELSLIKGIFSDKKNCVNKINVLQLQYVSSNRKARIILNTIFYAGRNVHKKTLKEYLTNYEYTLNNKKARLGNKDTIDSQLKKLELIGMITIKTHEISMTTASISYIKQSRFSNTKKQKVKQTILSLTQLEYNTRARLFATSKIVNGAEEGLTSDYKLLSRCIFKFSNYSYVIGSIESEHINSTLKRIRDIVKLTVQNQEEEIIQKMTKGDMIVVELYLDKNTYNDKQLEKIRNIEITLIRVDYKFF